MNRIDPEVLKTQRHRNEQSRGDWESFSRHRAQVTRLVDSVARQRSTQKDTPDDLLVLGAGNGNDLDLASIAARFGSITLVDLDAEAVSRCRDRLPAELADGVTSLAPVDLLVVSNPPPLAETTPGQWDDWLARAREPTVPSVPTADLVVSTCLISQLIDAVVQWMSPSDDRFQEAMIAIRDGHLHLVGNLVGPGGTIVLVTDFVSSDTLPALTSIPDEHVPALARDAVLAGNFFTGLNPAVLAQKLAQPRGDRGFTTTTHGPWRWRLGPRAYAVAAFTAWRK